LKIFITALLIFANGFFVMAEFALIRIRRTRLEELANDGNTTAKMALCMVDALDSYLSATQLGITLTSLAIGWLGEPAIATLLDKYIFQYFVHSELLLSAISFAIAFSTITFLHVVVGELVPRSLAIKKVEPILAIIVYPLYYFKKITYFITILFNHSSRFILGLFGIKDINETDETHSEEELRMLISASQRDGILDDVESRIIDNVFDFADRTAIEIMVPRKNMICLYTQDSIETNLEIIRSSGHTRYPLCDNDKDNIIGMIHIRDLLEATDLFSVVNNINFHAIKREVLMVTQHIEVSTLMQKMRKNRIHLAILIDEYGGTAGLVTLEDILEEIVGEILDEHDEITLDPVTVIPGGGFLLDGMVLMEDVAEILDADFEQHEEDTLGGYLFGILERKPQEGDLIVLNNYRFEILKTEDYRIMLVKVLPIEVATDKAE
jgi:CBS domain containing-hemolysin-like protein